MEYATTQERILSAALDYATEKIVIKQTMQKIREEITTTLGDTPARKSALTEIDRMTTEKYADAEVQFHNAVRRIYVS